MKNPIAEIGQPDSLDLVKPEDASPEGEYYCPDKNCLDPERKLTLKVSTLNNKYFSHRASCDHDVSPAMLLHKMVVAQLKLLPSILLPKTNLISQPSLFNINKEKSRIEYNPELNDVPEIMLINDKEEMVYIDVVFDEELSDQKYRAAVQQNIPYLILDLEDFYLDNLDNINDIDFLQEAVPSLLHNQQVKQWQFLPSHLRKFSKNKITKMLAGGLVGLAGIAGYFIYKNKK